MDSNTFIPQAFIDKMSTILPSHLNVEDLVSSCRRPLRRAIRINTIKISVDDFLVIAENKNWQLTPIPWCKTGFWIELDEQQCPLGNSAEHLAGLFYVQEASSMMPVSALTHHFQGSAQSTLLDAAAAPGSKTTQLAASMNNQGLIIANEYSSSRIKMLHANIQRCGIKNVALTHFDASVFGQWLPNTFDAILLDAPCSGEGTVRKDKQAMKNWDQSAIESISGTQKTLIESAFQALKPGAVMVYSTCTLSLEENQEVCLYLQETYPEQVEFLSLIDLFKGADKTVTEQGFLHIWPQVYDTEGFFVASIKKTGHVESPQAHKRLGKFPFQPAAVVTKENLFNYFQEQFGITEIEGVLYQRDDEFWLFPENIVPLINELRFSRLGIKIAEQFGKGRKSGFKCTHEFATCYGQQTTSSVSLLAHQAREYFQGRDIHDIDTQNSKGEVLLNYQGYIIGLGKSLDNRIKNSLPRDLIIDKNLFEE
ncbi:16S rRNA (cytosine(1407)-C(5))-methyltransferase RsmF [uncultured Psychromonas sp.]|uniref:16S rRNA (cytosine(1407)-C(5))-methyltransferase RsmF n=1 Tax=uncultured Psychromonas sp. TaxID=173974 RepID=UPI0026266C95|nr:16S rRNA (cytosine(1407)-C(5))-methyltransferase RsmF [uncultured Psychromonas sp.]